MKLLKVDPSIYSDNVTCIFENTQIVVKASAHAENYVGKDIEIKDGKILELRHDQPKKKF